MLKLPGNDRIIDASLNIKFWIITKYFMSTNKHEASFEMYNQSNKLRALRLQKKKTFFSSDIFIS